MRDIRFRAWNKKAKRMLMDVQGMYDGLGDWFDNHGKEVDLYNGEWYSSSFEAYLDSDEFVVMQYTGLKDKNGKEIYEGDIVTGIGNEKWTRDQKHVVQFKEGSFGLVWTNEGGYQQFHWFPTYIVFKHKGHGIISQAEVIGNIYENGELLK